MKHCRIDNYRFAYSDGGDGPPVLLLHCSSASHREWSFLLNELQLRHRVLAPDLLGYGQSEPFTAGRPFSPAMEVALIHELLAQADEPAHVIGHSYGGAMALEACRLDARRIRSMTLIEPVAFHLLRSAGRREAWEEIDGLAQRVIDAQHRGDSRAATRAYMTFWIGRVKWWLMSRENKQRIERTIAKVAAEFAALEQLPPAVDDYRHITTPTTLVTGAKTTASMHALTGVLLDTLADVREVTVAGAGHMSPFTHQSAIRDIVLDALARL